MQESPDTIETSTRSNATFLVCVSNSPESEVALHFACLRAKRRHAQVAMLHVIEPSDFQGLLSVSDVIRQEQEEAAQTFLNQMAEKAVAISGVMPALVLKEGKLGEEIVKATLENGDIIAVVLGAHHDSKRGSKLIAWLTGKLGLDLLVPLILVPGNLTDQQIDNLV